MAEPPNSSSSAASAVPFTGFGTAVYDINTDPNRFRYERYIRYLIENPWSFKENRPLKFEYPSPMICDATIHGSMLPRNFGAPPVFRVLPNFMIILASTGPHMGYLARTCLTAYNRRERRGNT